MNCTDQCLLRRLASLGLPMCEYTPHCHERAVTGGKFCKVHAAMKKESAREYLKRVAKDPAALALFRKRHRKAWATWRGKRK